MHDGHWIFPTVCYCTDQVLGVFCGQVIPLQHQLEKSADFLTCLFTKTDTKYVCLDFKVLAVKCVDLEEKWVGPEQEVMDAV